MLLGFVMRAFKKGARARAKRPGRKLRFKPGVEVLENRCLPAALNLVGGNVDVTQQPGWEAETSLAVNPNNPKIADEVSYEVTLNNAAPVGLLNATTAANPGGWTPNLIGTGADSIGAFAADPHVVYDDEYGNLFLVYLGANVAQKGKASNDAGAQNLKDTTRNWSASGVGPGPGQWNDAILSIDDGAAKGLVRGIVSNTRDTLQLADKWSIAPKKGDSYSILLAAPLYEVANGKPAPVERRVVSANGTTLGYGGELLPPAAVAGANNGDLYIKITAGAGLGEVRRIKSLDPFSNKLQVTEAWTVKPRAGSKFVILQSNPKTTHSLELDRSSNNGKSFQFFGRLAIGLVDFPNIATGPRAKNKPNDRSVWVTWSDLTFHDVRAGGVAIKGLGKFGTSSAVLRVASQSQFSSIAVGPDGQVAVAYDMIAPNLPTKVFVNTDAAGLNSAFGGAFRRPVEVRTSWLSAGREENIKLNAALAQPNRGIQLLPTMAWDVSGKVNKGRDGRLYLAYEFVQNAGALKNHNIIIHSIYSDNSGKNWKGDEAVNNLGGTQFNAAVAVDQATGNVAFTWYEAPNPNSSSVQLYGTASQTGTDGNNPFLAPIQVSKGTSDVKALPAGYNFDYGEYNGLAYINGVFQASWADNSNSTNNNPNKQRGLDIYTQEVQIVAQKGAVQPQPVQVAEGAPLQGTEIATFTSTDPQAAASQFSAVVLWGDGEQSSTAQNDVTILSDPTQPGVFDVIADKPNPYADEGDFTETVTVTDNINQTSASALQTVTVADAPLTAAGLASVIQLTAGQSFSGVIGTLHDDNLSSTSADFTVTVSWGDLTALDNNQTGTITLTPLGNGDFQISGTHSYPTPTTSAGSVYTIGIAIVDDGGQTASMLSTANVTVDTITLVSSAAPGYTETGFFASVSVVGQPITFTATVPPGSGSRIPTGTVEFEAFVPNGGIVPQVLGTGTLDASGQAQVTVNNLLAGLYSIFAAYSGDSFFQPSSSNSLVLQVYGASTELTVSAASTTVTAGQPVTLSSTLSVVPPGEFVAPPTGTVTFYDSGVAVGQLFQLPVNGSISWIFSGAGTYTIFAIYSGDSNYVFSESPAITLTVVSAGSSPAVDPPYSLSSAVGPLDTNDEALDTAFASYYLALTKHQPA